MGPTQGDRPALVAGALAVALGLVVLAGWSLGSAALKSVAPGLPSMKVNTAISLVGLGLALAAHASGLRRSANLAAVAGMTLGAATLVQSLFGVDLGIDELLFQDVRSEFTQYPGRMNDSTAATAVLLGAALLTVDRARARVHQLLAAVAGLIPVLSVVAFLFGATGFDGFAAFTTGMSFHSAVAFLVLMGGTLALRRREGWMAVLEDHGEAGRTAKRVLFVVLATPVVVGAVTGVGLRLGWFDPLFALAMDLVLLLAAVAGLSAHLLLRLDRIDEDRLAAREDLVALNRDLERRVAERTHEVRMERELFAALARDAPVGVFHADAGGAVDLVNPRWAAISGHPMEAALGSGWLDAVHPDERASVAASWRRATAEGTEFLETFGLLHPDGAVRWVVARAVPIRDEMDNVTGFVGTNEDVTDLRALEEQLRGAVATREAILSSSEDQVHVFDRALRWTYANPAAPAALGVRREDLLGRTWRDLGLPAEAMEPLEARVRTVFRTGEPIKEEVMDVGDEVRWSEYVVTPVGDPVERVVAVHRDVTDRRRAEEDRREAAQGRMLREQVEAESQFKTDFLNRAAHELATPLTPIVLQLDMLKRFLANVAGERERRSIDVLERNVERLRNLVEDLLAAARVQSASWAVKTAPDDVAGLVRTTAEEMRPAFDRKGVALEVEARDAPARVDARRVREAVENLLENALKFTPSGGSVRVRARHRGRDVVVEVVDSGIGFEPAAARELFRPFGQVHDTMQITEPGSGLGLFITKGIVEAHGGRVGIESAGPGQGTRAWFTVPVGQAQRSRPQRRVREPEATGRAR